MSGRIRVFSILLVAAIIALLGSLVIQKTEGGGMPKDIHLTAIIRGLDTDKIQDDGLGPYISGVAPTGTVDVHLDQHNGSLHFYIDKGTNPQVMGRYVDLKFDDPVLVDDPPVKRPCKDMDCCSAPFGHVSVQPQIFRMKTWYVFTPNANDPTLLDCTGPTVNLATMGMTVKKGKTITTYPPQAYVGMTINFWMTLDGEFHCLGDAGYAGEVIADDIGPSGPRHWTIKSLTYPLRNHDANDDDRQLIRGENPNRCSYGWFHFPFQIDLYRQ